jgi:hypothetical protein
MLLNARQPSDRLPRAQPLTRSSTPPLHPLTILQIRRPTRALYFLQIRRPHPLMEWELYRAPHEFPLIAYSG